MSVDIRSSDRRRYMTELQAREKEIAAGLLNRVSQPSSPKALQENEKRIRREIANSNERRRMQCINAGFSSLRALIPQLEGEKLSKAAILQHATEYISSLEKDKSRLQMQLEHTKGLLSELGQDRIVTDASYVSSSPPPSKRKKRDTESSDEGMGSLSDASDEGSSDLQHENVALRHQLEVERQRCATFEDRNRILEAQFLALLQVPASHPSSLRELRPVSLEHRPQLRELESMYTREMVEVVTSREKISSSPHPLSQSSEQRMEHESSIPLDATIHRSPVIDSPCYYPVGGEPAPPIVKMEVSPVNETSTHGSVPCVSFQGVVTTASSDPSTNSSVAMPEQSSRHLHNYCHRDHPRRRHRLQAQLEQQRADEELRRQQQEAAAQAATILHRPKSNTQNLENLVEAIRQIEGDRILSRFSEDEHILLDKRQNVPRDEDVERETSSVSDHDELKLESLDRGSPHHHQFQHQQNSNQSSSSISSSSCFSEKYPIATHLLHRPLHPSFYRPGVIVQKQ